MIIVLKIDWKIEHYYLVFLHFEVGIIASGISRWDIGLCCTRNPSVPPPPQEATISLLRHHRYSLLQAVTL
jgi:hypothetical protein